MLILRFIFGLFFNNLKYILGGSHRSFILPLGAHKFIILNRSLQIIKIPSINSYSTIMEIFFNRQYVRFVQEVNNFLRYSSDKKLVIFDLGANIGLFEIFMRQHLLEKVKIICYEPAENNYAYLQKNVSACTEVVTKAVSCREFAYATSSKHGDDVIIEPKNVNINGLTVSFKEEFLEKRKLINCVKVDIEGHEYELFDQNADWIKEINLMCVEFHDEIMNRHTSQPFLKSLSMIKHPIRMFFNDNMIWMKRVDLNESEKN